MRAWTRWQDWIALVAGAFVALSTIWVDTTNEGGALSTMLIIGGLLVIVSLVSLAAPGMVATEYVTAVLGLLLFIAPWVFTYTDRAGAAWTSWIVGIVGVAMGLAAVPVSTKAHRQAAQH